MVRLIFVLGLLLFLDWYVFQAFLTIAAEWSAIGKNILYSVYWGLPFLLISILILASLRRLAIPRKQFSLIRSLIFLSYVSKILIAGFLLMDDVRLFAMTLFDSYAGYGGLDYSRSVNAAKLAIGLGVIPFFVLLYGILRNPYRFKVFREKVKIKDLPAALNGLKIVQISDIHCGSFNEKEPLVKAIKTINHEAADLVFFTGDLVNSMAREMDGFIEIFKKIKGKYGVFSILGNHDYGDYTHWETVDAKKKNFYDLLAVHKTMGWDLMLNENRLIEVNGEEVAVIGVENYSADARFHQYGDLEKAAEGTANAALKLLLSHDPSHWDAEVVEKYQDIDMTFSGHTHGFQFGFEFGKFKWSPSKYLYKQWAGLYRKGSQFLYVNRGFGFLGYPGRIGILPEITVIELEKSNNLGTP